MDLATFQRQMRTLYGARDRAREFADVLAWLASLADQAGVDLARAAMRYADGCPRCATSPCTCSGDDRQ
ncbi:MAG: hypothetical protein ACRDYX_17670 [Egibacteraceae bacterium]